MPNTPIISIVDDNESVRLALKSLLSSMGLTTYIFASAEDFLRSSHVLDTSCLIVDVQMPNIGGIDLQRMLLAQGVHTPIIFITAFPEDRIRRQALKAGAVCFLRKPFDEKTLLQCLDKALKRNRS